MLEGFSPDAVSEVRRRLDMVRSSGVRILFAIESGSRAWGFPSPDSDYDCRFIYVRPIEDHLKLAAERDVIEFPIEGEIDTGGWDLRKALLLALKGNAVIGEWVHSPHVY
jgi:predicted nucleotidyltransferase